MTCYRYRIKQDDFFVEVLDKDSIPMHYSTIVNRLNKQDEIITKQQEIITELKKYNELMEKILDNISENLANYRNEWVDL